MSNTNTPVTEHAPFEGLPILLRTPQGWELVQGVMPLPLSGKLVVLGTVVAAVFAGAKLLGIVGGVVALVLGYVVGRLIARLLTGPPVTITLLASPEGDARALLTLLPLTMKAPEEAMAAVCPIPGAKPRSFEHASGYQAVEAIHDDDGHRTKFVLVGGSLFMLSAFLTARADATDAWRALDALMASASFGPLEPVFDERVRKALKARYPDASFSMKEDRQIEARGQDPRSFALLSLGGVAQEVMLDFRNESAVIARYVEGLRLDERFAVPAGAGA